MRQVFRLKSKVKGKHVYTTIFSGVVGDRLVNTGTLKQTVDEWRLFGALLRMGAGSNEIMRKTALVVFTGDEELGQNVYEKDENACPINHSLFLIDRECPLCGACLK